MKVEKSEIYTEEKSLILAPFQDNHYYCYSELFSLYTQRVTTILLWNHAPH